MTFFFSFLHLIPVWYVIEPSMCFVSLLFHLPRIYLSVTRLMDIMSHQMSFNECFKWSSCKLSIILCTGYTRAQYHTKNNMNHASNRWILWGLCSWWYEAQAALRFWWWGVSDSNLSTKPSLSEMMFYVLALNLNTFHWFHLCLISWSSWETRTTVFYHFVWICAVWIMQKHDF